MQEITKKKKLYDILTYTELLDPNKTSYNDWSTVLEKKKTRTELYNVLSSDIGLYLGSRKDFENMVNPQVDHNSLEEIDARLTQFLTYPSLAYTTLTREDIDVIGSKEDTEAFEQLASKKSYSLAKEHPTLYSINKGMDLGAGHFIDWVTGFDYGQQANSRIEKMRRKTLDDEQKKKLDKIDKNYALTRKIASGLTVSGLIALSLYATRGMFIGKIGQSISAKGLQYATPKVTGSLLKRAASKFTFNQAKKLGYNMAGKGFHSWGLFATGVNIRSTREGEDVWGYLQNNMEAGLEGVTEGMVADEALDIGKHVATRFASRATIGTFSEAATEQVNDMGNDFMNWARDKDIEPVSLLGSGLAHGEISKTAWDQFIVELAVGWGLGSGFQISSELQNKFVNKNDLKTFENTFNTFMKENPGKVNDFLINAIDRTKEKLTPEGSSEVKNIVDNLGTIARVGRGELPVDSENKVIRKASENVYNNIDKVRSQTRTDLGKYGASDIFSLLFINSKNMIDEFTRQLESEGNLKLPDNNFSKHNELFGYDKESLVQLGSAIDHKVKSGMNSELTRIKELLEGIGLDIKPVEFLMGYSPSNLTEKQSKEIKKLRSDKKVREIAKRFQRKVKETLQNEIKNVNKETTKEEDTEQKDEDGEYSKVFSEITKDNPQEPGDKINDQIDELSHAISLGLKEVDEYINALSDNDLEAIDRQIDILQKKGDKSKGLNNLRGKIKNKIKTRQGENDLKETTNAVLDEQEESTEEKAPKQGQTTEGELAETYEDLDKNKVQELKKIAKDEGISGYSRLTKPELINKILGGRKKRRTTGQVETPDSYKKAMVGKEIDELGNDLREAQIDLNKFIDDYDKGRLSKGDENQYENIVKQKKTNIDYLKTRIEKLGGKTSNKSQKQPTKQQETKEQTEQREKGPQIDLDDIEIDEDVYYLPEFNINDNLVDLKELPYKGGSIFNKFVSINEVRDLFRKYEYAPDETELFDFIISKLGDKVNVVFSTNPNEFINKFNNKPGKGKYKYSNNTIYINATANFNNKRQIYRTVFHEGIHSLLEDITRPESPNYDKEFVNELEKILRRTRSEIIPKLTSYKLNNYTDNEFIELYNKLSLSNREKLYPLYNINELIANIYSGTNTYITYEMTQIKSDVNSNESVWKRLTDKIVEAVKRLVGKGELNNNLLDKLNNVMNEKFKVRRLESEYGQLENELTKSTSNIDTSVDEENLIKKIQRILKQKYPEIKLKITNNPKWGKGDNVFNQKEYDNEVNFRLKVVDALLKLVSNRKTIKLNTKDKPNIETNLRKTLHGKGVTDQQIDFIFDYMRSNNIQSISTHDLILKIAHTYDYTIEIDTSETIYYPMLSVPGGKNYNENEIATPNIVPGVKGHPQFSTYKGIGWFRSDEVETDANIRRMLELQSDLFQKSRDQTNLTEKVIEGEIYLNKNNNRRYKIIRYEEEEPGEFLGEENQPEPPIPETLVIEYSDGIEQTLYDYEVDNLLEDSTRVSPSSQPKNQFLQLLNKNNNWVTFFIKSILQDSAKKGYSKVRFPKGDTAAKVEGQTTLEEFKEQKETRIKNLKQDLKIIEKYDNIKLPSDLTKINIGSEFLGRKYVKIDGKWYKSINGEVDKKQEYSIETITEAYRIDLISNYTRKDYVSISKNKEYLNDEIEALEKELADIESGETQLSSIPSFYENTVANILKKQGYSPTEITDEYGNKWNEVNINIQRELSNIMLQKDETGKIIGQANIKAGTVLIDAIRQNADTLPHEYAHHYIAWFRDTPIVQEGIKRFNGEENLVDAIGKQVVKQEGEAYNWWKKFTSWVKELFSDKELLNFLTDSFLNRVDLTKIPVETSNFQGIEISSNSKGLGGALTNPTSLSKKKGNIKQDYPITYNNTSYRDVEAAYQQLKDKNEAKTKLSKENSGNYKLMVNLITAKLQQYPQLITEITKQGGSNWIMNSTHQPTKQNKVWETGGQNWFIEALNDAYNNVTQQSTESEQTSKGFQGYKGGYEDKGKGTSRGDGKDRAMRKVANAFVGEMDSRRSSSTFTSAKEIQNKMEQGTSPIVSGELFIDNSDIGVHEVYSLVKGLEKEDKITAMLARNGKLKNRELNTETKNKIKKLHEDWNAEFVVGDMPGVDSQFIDYLQEIGAKFTIYHTGNKSRIEVQKTQSTQQSIKPGVSELFKSDPELANIGTQEQYSQYLATIFPNSEVKDIYQHSSNVNLLEEGFKKGFGKTSDAFFFDKLESDKYSGKYNVKVLLNVNNTFYRYGDSVNKYLKAKYGENVIKNIREGMTLEMKGYIDNVSNREAKREYLSLNEEELPDSESSQFIKKHTIKELQKYGNFDSIIAQGYLAVFEPEQIHILGSKQDIEGFRNFIKNNIRNKKQTQSTQQPTKTRQQGTPITNQHQEKEPEVSKVDTKKKLKDSKKQASEFEEQQKQPTEEVYTDNYTDVSYVNRGIDPNEPIDDIKGVNNTVEALIKINGEVSTGKEQRQFLKDMGWNTFKNYISQLTEDINTVRERTNDPDENIATEAKRIYEVQKLLRNEWKDDWQYDFTYEEFIENKIRKTWNTLLTENPQTFLNIEYMIHGKGRLGNIEIIEQKDNFKDPDGKKNSTVQPNLLIHEYIESLKYILNIGLQVHQINAFINKMNPTELNTFDDSEFTTQDLADILNENGYLFLNKFGEKKTLPILKLDGELSIATKRWLNELEARYIKYLPNMEYEKNENHRISNIVRVILEELKHDATIEDIRAIHKDGDMNRSKLATEIEEGNYEIKDLVSLMKRSYLASNHYKTNLDNDLIEKHNLENTSRPTGIEYDSKNKQAAARTLIINTETNFNALNDDVDTLLTVKDDNGNDVSLKINMRELLVNELGIPTTDGMSVYILDDFDNFYFDLHGDLKRGDIKNFVAYKGLFIKHSIQGIGETKGYNKAVLARWMKQNDIAMITFDSAEKNGIYKGNIVNLNDLSESNKTALDKKVISIPIDNFIPTESKHGTGKAKNKVKGLRQLLQSSGLIKQSEVIRSIENGDRIIDIFRNMNRRLADKFNNLIEEWANDKEKLFKFTERLYKRAKNAHEKQVASSLISILEDTETSREDKIKQISGIFDHPWLSPIVSDRIRSFVMDTLGHKIKGSDPVLGADMGWLTPDRINQIKTNVFWDILDLPTDSDIFQAAIPNFSIDGVHVKYHIKDLVEFTRNINNLKAQLESNENEDGEPLTDKEIIARSEELETLKTKYKELFNKVRENYKGKENATTLSQFISKKDSKVDQWVEKQLSKKIDMNTGRLKKSYTLISEDVAAKNNLHVGDRVIVTVTPTESAKNMYSVEVAGIMPVKKPNSKRKPVSSPNKIILNSEMIQSAGKDYDVDVVYVFPYDKSLYTAEEWAELTGIGDDFGLISKIDETYTDKIVQAYIDADVDLSRFYNDAGKLVNKEAIVSDKRANLEYMINTMGSKSEISKFNIIGTSALKLGNQFTKNVSPIANLRTVHDILNSMGITSSLTIKNKQHNLNYNNNHFKIHETLRVATHDMVDFPKRANKLFYNSDEVDFYKLVYGINTGDNKLDTEYANDLNKIHNALFHELIQLPRGIDKNYNERTLTFGSESDVSYINTLKEKLLILDKAQKAENDLEKAEILAPLIQDLSKLNLKHKNIIAEYLLNMKIENINGFIGTINPKNMDMEKALNSLSGMDYNTYRNTEFQTFRTLVNNHSDMFVFNNEQILEGIYNKAKGHPSYTNADEIDIKTYSLILAMQKRDEKLDSHYTVKNNRRSLYLLREELANIMMPSDTTERTNTKSTNINWMVKQNTFSSLADIAFAQKAILFNNKYPRGSSIEFKDNGNIIKIIRGNFDEIMIEFNGERFNSTEISNYPEVRNILYNEIFTKLINMVKFNDMISFGGKIGTAKNIPITDRIKLAKTHINNVQNQLTDNKHGKLTVRELELIFTSMLVPYRAGKDGHAKIPQGRKNTQREGPVRRANGAYNSTELTLELASYFSDEFISQYYRLFSYNNPVNQKRFEEGISQTVNNKVDSMMPEWTSPRRAMNIDNVLQRYEERDKDLERFLNKSRLRQLIEFSKVVRTNPEKAYKMLQAVVDDAALYKAVAISGEGVTFDQLLNDIRNKDYDAFKRIYNYDKIEPEKINKLLTDELARNNIKIEDNEILSGTNKQMFRIMNQMLRMKQNYESKGNPFWKKLYSWVNSLSFIAISHGQKKYNINSQLDMPAIDLNKLNAQPYNESVRPAIIASSTLNLGTGNLVSDIEIMVERARRLTRYATEMRIKFENIVNSAKGYKSLIYSADLNKDIAIADDDTDYHYAKINEEVFEVAERGFKQDVIYSQVGYELTKDGYVYTFRDKEYTDENQLALVVTSAKYGPSNEQFERNKNLFLAALQYRKFYDQEILFRLQNVRKHLKRVYDYMSKKDNTVSIQNAEFIGKMIVRYNKIIEAIEAFQNDSEMSYMTHRYREDNWRIFYRQSQFNKLSKELLDKRDQEIKKRKENKRYDVEIANMTDEDINNYIREQLDKKINDLSYNNPKLMFNPNWQQRLGNDEKELYDKQTDNPVLAYIDDFIKTLKEDMIYTDALIYEERAVESGESSYIKELVKQWYANQLKNKRFHTQYVSKNNLKKGMEIEFLYTVNGAERQGWGEITKVNKNIVEFKIGDKRVEFRKDKIYTRDINGKEDTGAVKRYMFKGVVEHLQRLAEEKGWDEARYKSELLKLAKIPRIFDTAIGWTILGGIAQAPASLKNALGAYIEIKGSTMMSKIGSYGDKNMNYIERAKEAYKSLNLTGEIKSEGINKAIGKEIERALEQLGIHDSEQGKSILRASEQLGSHNSAQHLINVIYRGGELETSPDAFNIDPKSRWTKEVRIALRVIRDKFGWSEHNKKIKELEEQLETVSVAEEDNIRRQIKEENHRWEKKKREIARESATIKDKFLDKLTGETTNDEAVLNEFINMDSAVAWKVLSKVLAQTAEKYSYKLFMKPEPYFRRISFFAGLFEALDNGFDYEDAILIGMRKERNTQGSYEGLERQFGWNTTQGKIIFKFAQYSYNQFRRYRQLIPEVISQALENGYASLSPLKQNVEVDGERKIIGYNKKGEPIYMLNTGKKLATMMATHGALATLSGTAMVYGFGSITNPVIGGLAIMVKTILDIAGDGDLDADDEELFFDLVETLFIFGYGTTLPIQMLFGLDPITNNRTYKMIESLSKWLNGEYSNPLDRFIGLGLR